MIGVRLKDPSDQKSAYTFNLIFSVLGIPFEFIEEGPGSNHELLISYGCQPDLKDLNGPYTIAIPFHSQIGVFRGEVVERDVPQISSFVLFRGEKIPFYYPFAIFSEGEILCRYETGGGAVRKEGSSIVLGFDIIASAFYLLSLGEERGAAEHFGETFDRRDTRQATVDEYMKVLRFLIQLCLQEQELPLVSKWHWPSGKRFGVCLSHDVDKIHGREPFTLAVELYRVLRKLVRGHLRESLRDIQSLRRLLLQKEDSYWSFEKWMEMEDRYELRSTFYFMGGRRLGRYGRRYNWKKLGRVMRQLVDGGWEVGLHGSYYSWRDPGKLEKEKKELEHIMGDEVSGNRQHYLRFDPKASCRCYRDAGFEYDTTLGYNDQIGYRAGISFPFYPYDEAAGHRLELLEIPLVVMDAALVEGSDSLIGMIERTNVSGGSFSLLWHQSAFDEAETYEAILKYIVENDGWAATGKEMTKWWRSRSECRYEYEFIAQTNTIYVTMQSKYPEGLYLNVTVPEGDQYLIKCQSGERRIGTTRVIIEADETEG